MTERRCTICSRLLAARRRAGWPHARTCGAVLCSVEHKKRVHNILALRLKRQRAAKKEPAQRARPAHGLAAGDGFLSVIRRIASGALRVAERALGVHQRRRRAATKRWRQTTGHAYPQTAEQVAWADKLAAMCEPAAIQAAAKQNAADLNTVK